MSTLEVTLIDVGWGDSILIESKDGISDPHYGLVDSNDTSSLRSSYIFLKRYFERKNIEIDGTKHIFDFVLLSHAHADHGHGLKEVLRTFGTQNFWYPKSLNWGSLADLIRFSNRSARIVHHQSIDDTKILPSIGNVKIGVLWPPYGNIDGQSENNNSIVFSLLLGNVSFILTGDAEAGVWNQIANKIPNNTQFFKVPHHGSNNGTFDDQNNAPWFNRCPRNAKLGISSHVRPHGHPDQDVINLFQTNHMDYFRTDEHYHITFKTEGNTTEVKYSHL